MLRQMGALARDSLVYGLSTVLGRLLNFLVTPLLTYALSPAENGEAATLYSAVAFLSVLLSLGLDTAYLRHGRREGKADPAAFSSAFWCLAVTAAAAAGLLHLAAPAAAAALGGGEPLARAARLSAWILALDAAAAVPFAELRADRRAGAYAGVKLAGLAANLLLAWLLVARLRLGLPGVFLANLAASALSLALLSPVIARAAAARPDPALLRGLLLFGLPLVPAGLASMVVQVADRPILAALAGPAAAGIYSACYKLGVFMMLVTNMFDQAWKPFFLQRARSPDLDALMARALTYFCAVACGIFLALALFVEPLVKAPLWGGRPLFHPAFWPGLPVAPVVTLGYLLAGFYYVMLAPLLVAGRTGAVAAAAATGAAANLAANLALIPRFGMMGAAWATAAAYAAMAAAVWALGRRARPVPYEWGRVLLAAGWTGALWAAGLRLPPWARLAALAAYPAGLWAAGFITREEAREARELIAARAAAK